MTTRHLTAMVLSATLLIAMAPMAQAACEGLRVDGSTADTAAKKARTAGYQKVTGWRKGCDSVWHGKAVKGAGTVNIAVMPSGEVLEEGD